MTWPTADAAGPARRHREAAHQQGLGCAIWMAPPTPLRRPALSHFGLKLQRNLEMSQSCKLEMCHLRYCALRLIGGHIIIPRRPIPDRRITPTRLQARRPLSP